jgi:hypothetical protein
MNIKDCPFCGGNPIVEPYYHGKKIEGYTVACLHEGCVNPQIGRDGDSSKAIAAWNPRTRPDPAEVEMIVDDCLRRYSLAHLALEDAVEENLYQEDIAECNERMDKARADLLKLVGGE